MKAITTKYRGATNTRKARIIATDCDNNTARIPYPRDYRGDKAHAQAALALARKMNWTGKLIGGCTKDGYAFVFVDGAEEYII